MAFVTIEFAILSVPGLDSIVFYLLAKMFLDKNILSWNIFIDFQPI